MIEAGFDAVPYKVDISDRKSVLALITAAQKEGEISMFVNAPDLSPSQATKKYIMRVDLY